MELLGEFSAYSHLVVEVAKYLFYDSHPDRKRVPRGFVESFKLTMTGIDEGSAIPVLERDLPPKGAQLRLQDQTDYFDSARGVINDCILAAAEGKSLPELPDHIYSLFNTFGQRLLSDESIELCLPQQSDGPKYTSVVRKSLVLAKASTYEAPLDVIASIFDVNSDSCIFQFKTSEGVRLSTAFAPERTEDFLRFHQERDSSYVRVIGTASFDAHDHPNKLVDLDDVVQVRLEDIEIADRLGELGELGPGWLDGEGAPLAREGLAWLTAFLADLMETTSTPGPHLYPTLDGNVQGEWTVGDWEIAAVFDLSEHSIYASALNILTDVEVEAKIESGGIQKKESLSEFVLQFCQNEEE